MPGGPELSRRHILAAGVGIGLGAAVARVAPRSGGPVVSAPAAGAAPAPSLTVDPGRVVGALPSRSLGLSFEKATLALPLFSADNAALVGLLRLLGPGVLRLGGNSVERTTWAPDGPGGVPGAVSPADLDRLAAFAAEVDWPVIYGTPFIGSTATAVADEAARAAEHLGAHLAGIELCNEPDLYVLDPTASAVAGTPSAFRARWETFAAAIEAATPGVTLTGPATCLLQSVSSWTEPFATAEAGRVGLLTQHYYRGFGGTETIDELLGDDPLLDATLPVVAAAADGAGIGFRLAETNSFASGGAPGVSNTLASALWGVGLVLEAAAAGAGGVNIHTSGAGAGYPPFVQVNGQVTQIRPLFYGLLLAAGAGPGSLVATTLTDAPDTLRAWAVARPDGTLGLALVNVDADTDAGLVVDVGSAVATARSSALAGPGLAATSGVTFAGASVDIDGTWTAEPPTSQAIAGTRITTTVPAGSASLLVVTLVPPPSSTSTTTSGAPVTPAPASAVAATPELTG
jgi:hypothetical protein